MELYEDFGLPTFLIATSLAAGIIADQILLWILPRSARRTGRDEFLVLSQSLRTLPIFWFTLAGIAAALPGFPVRENLQGDLQDLIVILLIVSVTILLIRLLTGFIDLYGHGSGNGLATTTIFTNVARLAAMIVGILVALQYLGIPITPLLTALGVGGLAVALALQDTLSNLFAGMQVIASRQIRLGDYIKLDSGEEGEVEDITWRNTIIKGVANHLVIVPNAKLAAIIFTNYHLPEKEISVVMQARVSYDSDLAEVERVTLEVGREVQEQVPGAVSGYEPVVRYHTLGADGIEFAVVLRAQTFANQFLMKHEFIQRLHLRYQEAGIQIPYHTRSVYVRGLVAGGKAGPQIQDGGSDGQG